MKQKIKTPKDFVSGTYVYVRCSKCNKSQMMNEHIVHFYFKFTISFFFVNVVVMSRKSALMKSTNQKKKTKRR